MPDTHIVLVHGQDSDLADIKKTLTKKGFRVDACASGFAALDKLRGGDADLVLVSMELPDIEGFQLCSLIKSTQLINKLPVAIYGSKAELKDSFWRRVSDCDLLIESQNGGFKDDAVLEKLKALIPKIKGKRKAKSEESSAASESFNGADSTKSFQKLSASLILESSVNEMCALLIEAVGSRVEFMSRYFGYMKRVFGCDVCGLVAAGGHQPWAIYELTGNVGQPAFEKLKTTVNNDLGIPTNVQEIRHGQLPDKGTVAIKHHEVIKICGAEGEVLGGIVLAWQKRQPLDESMTPIADLLRLKMKPVFKALSAWQQVQALRQEQSLGSFIDQVTGLYNIQFLIGFLQQQLLFSARQKLPVGLVLIDIDHFEKLNQTHGAEAGNLVLMGIANKLNSNIRASDLLARYSGDQFAIVLPNTQMAGSQTLAEKLRQEVEGMTWEAFGQKSLRMTISVGCAAFNMEDLNPETILRDAKVSLMSAKEAGRNRVGVVPDAQ